MSPDNRLVAIRLLLTAGRPVDLEMAGTSMLPLIRPGDKITVAPIQPEKIRRGDVAVFIRDRELIVHRIIRRCEHYGRWWFCQKGDNLLAWSWMTQQDILAKVTAVAGNGRRIRMGRGAVRYINFLVGALAGGLAFCHDMMVGKTAGRASVGMPGGGTPVVRWLNFLNQRLTAAIRK